MEFEIDDCDALFDKSTNPSLARRPHTRSRHARLSSWKPRQKAVVIPEEEEQFA